MNLETILNNGRKKGADKGRESSVGVAGLRLEVKLMTPTDERSNEFSYPQLVLKRIRELGGAVGGVAPQKPEPPPIGKDPSPLLPGEEDEDQRLAAIAKKFEEKYGESTQDLVDIGEGYDTSDSFVDDSELYEDYVPPQVDTMFGGFYINNGELVFTKNKNLTDFGLSSKSKEERPKKRHLNTPQAIANKKIKRAKRQMAVSSAQRSNILKKKLTLTTTTEGLKQTTVAMDTGPRPPLIINEDTEFSTGTIKTTCPALPDGLPLTLINKIKQVEESLSVDHANSLTGKLTCKVKTSYDKQLVDIDNECKSLKIKIRVNVLEYLAYQFGINRTSLMNRIKRILKKQETGNVDLDAALAQLKEAVNEVMLPLLSKYEIDLEKYENERKQIEATPTTVIKTEPGETNEGAVPPVVVANGKKLQKPQRKFQWTERIRLLLVTVVKAKVDKELIINKTRTQTGEEIILEFIERHVRSIWPKGWVQKKALYKMTESAHFKLTQSDSQHKKLLQVKERVIKDESLTQSAKPQTSVATPTVSDETQKGQGVGLTTPTSIDTGNTARLPQINPPNTKTTPTKTTPTIKGRVDATTPTIKTEMTTPTSLQMRVGLVTPASPQKRTGLATPPLPHHGAGLATPPKLISPSVSKSPSADFSDLQYKLKSVPPILIKGATPPSLLIKGASPVYNMGVSNVGVTKANVGVAKGATPPPLLIKGALSNVGVSVPSSGGVITGFTKATPPPTNVTTSRGGTLPGKATPPPIDSRHKVVKKPTKVQSVQLPKQTIDALLSVLKNTNSSIYTSDLAQLVTVTTRQQTTPTQRPVTSSPSPSSLRIVQAPLPATPPTQRPVTSSPSQSLLRIVQAPPPATPPSTTVSSHHLSDHYYVTGPSAQYIPTSTSGVSLITSNLINKTTNNN